MVWQVGQKVYGDRYTIEKVLGQGGFGIAYLARDRHDRPVVIKTLRDEILLDQQAQYFCDRFKDEALKLAVCRHPHIVSVQNTFTESYTVTINQKCYTIEAFCLVMEFIAGQNLEQVVVRGGCLSERDAIAYLQQVGSALEYVHELGVLHRDIKPTNILIRADSQKAVLIDFGLARNFVRSADKNMTVALTHGYAPPEQYAPNSKFTEAMDVYALSATAYYIVTGKVPVSAMDRLLNQANLPPVHKLRPQISHQFSELIEWGMALQVEQRCPSIATWLEKLSALSPPMPSKRVQPVADPAPLALDKLDPELLQAIEPVGSLDQRKTRVGNQPDLGGILDFDQVSAEYGEPSMLTPDKTQENQLTELDLAVELALRGGTSQARSYSQLDMDDIVFLLKAQDDQSLLRMKKIMYVLCRGKFPAPTETMPKLSELLAELLHKYSDYIILQKNMDKVLQRISKPEVYRVVADTLLKILHPYMTKSA